MEKQNQQNKDQGYGIAALVIGVFAALFSFIPCVGVISIVLGALSIIFGSIALSQAQQTNVPKGSAIAGIVLGGIALLIALFWIVFLLGAKDKFKDTFEDKFEQFQYWSDDSGEFEDNFDDIDSLDELEKALDDLEGEMKDVQNDIDTVNEMTLKEDNGWNDEE